MFYVNRFYNNDQEAIDVIISTENFYPAFDYTSIDDVKADVKAELDHAQELKEWMDNGYMPIITAKDDERLERIKSTLVGCDLVMLESNHDVKMLQSNSLYPYPLKKRILSDEGHLSNNACADESAKLLQSGTTRFVLAHLSRENNLPPLAKETTRAQLSITGAKDGVDYRLAVAAPFDNRMIIL